MSTVMLLEDYTGENGPEIVGNVRNCVQNSNTNDLMAGFVYLLMLECGFIPLFHQDTQKDFVNTEYVSQDFEFNYKRLVNYSKKMPADWKTNCYQFTFVLRPFSAIKCRIVCIHISDYFVVNCFTDYDKFTLILDPLLYCVNEGKICQNLRQLSTVFKEVIGNRAKVDIMARNGAICPCLMHFYQLFGYLLKGYLGKTDWNRLERALSVK